MLVVGWRPRFVFAFGVVRFGLFDMDASILGSRYGVIDGVLIFSIISFALVVVGHDFS
jgi:hypothetical protein